MAHIRKLSNNTYQAAIYVGKIRDTNGKDKKEYVYVTKDTLKECKAAVKEIEYEIEMGTFINVGNKIAVDFMDQWINLRASELSSSTLKTYRMYINYHFKPFFKTIKIKDVNELLIKQYIAQKLKSLSSCTVRKHFFLIGDILEDALKFKNPCKYITPPEGSKYKPKVPTEEEFDILHNAVKGMWDEIPILLAAWCGMREGEIFALKWDDIDFEKGTIKVDENMAISDTGYRPKDPKSENGFRTIVLQEYILNLLELKKQTKDKKQKAKKINDKLYEIRDQQTRENAELNEYIKATIFKMRPDSYCKRFIKIIKTHNELYDTINGNKEDTKKPCHTKKSLKAQLVIQGKKIPKFRFHDLRHYHATDLYEKGIADQYAAERMGHDIRVLKGIYQHLGLEKKREYDEKVKRMYNAK